MTLNVGRLVAELELQDAAFLRAADSAEARLRQLDTAATAANRSLRDLSVPRDLDSTARTAQQAIERIGDSATGASRDVGRLDQAATGAAASMRGMDIPSGIADAANRAAAAVDRIGESAESTGASGNRMGSSFVSGFADKISNLAGKGGPIAGALLGVVAIGVSAGALLAKAISDGLSEELDRDMFQAKTRTTEAQAARFAQAAAESYSDVFGESVAANLSTLKLSVQSGIIDRGATQREAEAVVAELDTITNALDGEVTVAVEALSALMSSGLAASSTEAADAIAAAVGGSANRGGDLLETVREYSAGWAAAGFSAQQALALIEQATDMGVDNSDRAGDALREFGRRVTEEEDTIVEALDEIGLNGQSMYERFAAGGDTAFQAFDEAFDAIRQIEDPIKRNEAALALLGDTAGDFITTFTKWDPSEASAKFGETEGAASRLAGIMGGNASTSVEGAMRSISTIAEQLKAALASAFGPEIQEWANGISNNRAGVVQFFIDVGNAAFEGAKVILEFTAGGMRGLAQFAGAAGDMSGQVLRSIADMIEGFDLVSDVLGVVLPGFSSALGDGDLVGKLNTMADAAETAGTNIESGLTAGATAIDEKVIPGLTTAQERFNQFGQNVKLSAAFNDATAKLTAAVGDIGVAADGSTLKLQNWTGAIDRSSPAQVTMEERLRGLVGVFEAQTRAGLEAGASVEELTTTYDANRVALIEQLMATGMSNQAALTYLNSLGLMPNLVATQIATPGMPEAHFALDVLTGKVLGVPSNKEIHTSALTQDATDALEHLGLKVTTLPDGTVSVTANTDAGQAIVDGFLERNKNRNLTITAEVALQARVQNGDLTVGPMSGWATKQADGGVMTFAAADGMMPNQAVIQPAAGPNGVYQWRENDAGPWEAFIPGAASKRTRALQIWGEAGRRMGVLGSFADGGVIDSISSAVTASGYPVTMTSGKRTATADDPTSYHNTGQAADYGGATADLLGLANHMADKYQTQLAELIFDNPAFGRQIKDGKFVDSGFYAGAGDHTTHVHIATRKALELATGKGGTGTGAAATDSRTDRQKLVDTIVAEGRAAGLTDADIAAIVAAGLVESNLQNVDYGPDGSLGYLQQRDFDEWTKGGTRDRMNPTDATRSFIEKYQATDASKSPAERVADVQRPREDLRGLYGDRYAEAEALVAESNSRTASASPSSSPSSSSTSSPSSTLGATSSGPIDVNVQNFPAWFTSGSTDERTPRATLNARLFEDGGINEAMIGAPGDIRVWNEPEAGGEGYVPFAASKRTRALAVWAEIGRRIGVPGFADGGGFGGYTGGDDRDWMAPRNAYDVAALASGLIFTAASGLSGIASMASSGTVDLGNILPSFDTGSTEIPGLSDAFESLVAPLEEILTTLKGGGMVTVDVDIDTSTGGVNASLQRAGIA